MVYFSGYGYFFMAIAVVLATLLWLWVRHIVKVRNERPNLALARYRQALRAELLALAGDEKDGMLKWEAERLNSSELGLPVLESAVAAARRLWGNDEYAESGKPSARVEMCETREEKTAWFPLSCGIALGLSAGYLAGNSVGLLVLSSFGGVFALTGITLARTPSSPNFVGLTIVALIWVACVAAGAAAS